MCTSMSYRKTDHYFGRNLDIEVTFGEKVVITPRNYKFELKNGTTYHNSYAMIGMAVVLQKYPLYYEAANEKGLAMAGLNFVGNAKYLERKEGMENITPFELIPWILGQAESVKEARALLTKVNLLNCPFAESVPLASLHFMISDKKESIVVEPMEDGLHIFSNPYDVMTNNPPFEYHMWNMNNYLNLKVQNGENTFSSQYGLKNYGVGMGAIGLPGDASSASRFVRTAFHLTNSYSDDTEVGNVTQLFHVLDSVSMLQGSTLTDEGKHDMTMYSCCINVDKGIYYYKTYGNNQIHGVKLHQIDLEGKELYCYELDKKQNISYDNE